MNKKLRTFLIILAIAIVVSFLAVSVYTGEQVFRGCVLLTDNEKTALNREKSYGLGENGQSYVIEQISIPSSLGTHEIPADYISCDGDKNRDTVILAHGLGGNRLSNYPIAEMFLRHGFNVISYDQRATGENLAQYNTFGYLESKDTIDYVNYADKLIDADKAIVLWGTSFGGATVGMAMADDYVNQRVGAAVLDCPVSSMSEMTTEQIKRISDDTGIPVSYMLWTGELALKRHLGFSFEDAEITDYVSKSQIPLLVINTKADKVTPYHMGVDIYEASAAELRDIFTVEDSAHANIFFDYREEYERRIFLLLDSVLPARSAELNEEQLAA